MKKTKNLLPIILTITFIVAIFLFGGEKKDDTGIVLVEEKTPPTDILGAITLWFLDGITLKPVDSTWSVETGELFGSASNLATSTAQAKGDLIVASSTTEFTNLNVGSDDTVLTADSTAAFGIAWKAAGGGVENIFTQTNATTIEATTTDAGIGLKLDFFTATSTTATSTFDGFVRFDQFIDFDEITEPATPVANIERMWTEDNNGKTFLKMQGSDGIIKTFALDSIFIARNTSGSLITRGSVVRITGGTGQVQNIALAQSNATSTMPAAGLTIEDIDNNGFGLIVHTYDLTMFDTSAFTEGATLYVASTTAGDLSEIVPQHPNLTQPIAVVTLSGVNGVLHINSTQTVQGSETGTISNFFNIGDTVSGGAVRLMFENGNRGNLTWTPTADRTITIPDAGGIIGLLELAQTWTGLQSFNNASSTLFSVFDTAYFGGTATSTFSSAGVLTLIGNLIFDSQTFDSFTDDATLTNNSGDLRVVDVNCTGCLSATELATNSVGADELSSTAIQAGDYPAAGIDGDDINSNIAGAHITLTSGSPDTLDIDSEIFTKSFTANIASSTMSTTTSVGRWKAPTAITLTEIGCDTTAGTSTIKMDIRAASTPNSSGTAVLFAGGLACGSGFDIASTTFANTAMTAGQKLNFEISDADPVGTPATVLNIYIKYTIND